MIVREIVRTCSNPHVARAAVASIGVISHDASRATRRSGTSRAAY